MTHVEHQSCGRYKSYEYTVTTPEEAEGWLQFKYGFDTSKEQNRKHLHPVLLYQMMMVISHHFQNKGGTLNKKKTFEVSINNLPAALKRLDLPAEQVKVIEDYKKQFPFLIEDEENVLVSLDQLWEALDTPYYTPPGKGPKVRTT